MNLRSPKWTSRDYGSTNASLRAFSNRTPFNTTNIFSPISQMLVRYGVTVSCIVPVVG